MLGACSKRAQIEKEIQKQNEQLPMDFGSGMVWTHVDLEGDYVVFTYECPAEVPTAICSQKDSFRSSFRSALNSYSTEYKEAGLGIKCIFRSSGGESCDIAFEKDDL